MALMNLGVNERAHCKLGVAGSFRAHLSWIFTDQQALGATLVTNFLLYVLTS